MRAHACAAQNYFGPRGAAGKPRRFPARPPWTPTVRLASLPPSLGVKARNQDCRNRLCCRSLWASCGVGCCVLPLPSCKPGSPPSAGTARCQRAHVRCGAWALQSSVFLSAMAGPSPPGTASTPLDCNGLPRMMSRGAWPHCRHLRAQTALRTPAPSSFHSAPFHNSKTPRNALWATHSIKASHLRVD